MDAPERLYLVYTIYSMVYQYILGCASEPIHPIHSTSKSRYVFNMLTSHIGPARLALLAQIWREPIDR